MKLIAGIKKVVRAVEPQIGTHIPFFKCNSTGEKFSGKNYTSRKRSQNLDLLKYHPKLFLSLIFAIETFSRLSSPLKGDFHIEIDHS